MKRTLMIAAVMLSCWSARTRGDDADSGAKADDLFQKLDTNHDGKLTSSEIPQEHRKFFNRLLRVANAEEKQELTRKEFDSALKRNEEPVIDINSAGGLGLGPAGAPKFNPKRIFTALDKNKDGKLTRDEASGRPRIEALFDRLGKDELTLDDLSSLANKGGKPKANKKKAKKALISTPAAASAGLSPLFKLLDANHDGKLSKEEFSKAADMFEQLDRNQDGFLDRRELTGASSPADKEEMEAGPPAALPKGQRPGKGLGRPGNGRRLTQMIKNADTDGDGKLSMDEAPGHLKKHFAQIDTNGDGLLDMGELAAWMRTHRKRPAMPENGNE